MIEITPLEVQEKLNTIKRIHRIDVREVDKVKEIQVFFATISGVWAGYSPYLL